LQSSRPGAPGAQRAGRPITQNGTVRRHAPTPQAPSKFPMVVRDLAFVVSTDVAAGQIASTILKLKQKSNQLLSLNNFKCFDEYRGQGIAVNEKSLAFRFYFQDTLRTLEDADIEQAIEVIVRAVQEDCKATLRVA
jgi:phenylalanyl-tRNA synthetase beta chain